MTKSMCLLGPVRHLLFLIGLASVLVGAGRATQPLDHHAYLPLTARSTTCSSITGASYGTLPADGPHPSRPPAQHPDLSLAVRSYTPTDAFLGLIDYGGDHDPRAPQLSGLFAPQRVPAFRQAYQVYDWDWDCDCRSGPISSPDVTLLGMATAPGEPIHVPASGYTIGSGYEVLVLYADPSRVTLKYTREDNVISGYTLHVENVCVDPDLVALYAGLDEAGRARLPALRQGQPFAQARRDGIKVAIRDHGRFLDPRSRKDWWQGR